MDNANQTNIGNRYIRQELLWGSAGQEKLNNSTITIIGDDSFCFPAALNSVLVGINTRLIISKKSKKEEKTLDFIMSGEEYAKEYQTILSRINPLVTVSQLPACIESDSDGVFLSKSNAVIDLTNNRVSKEIAAEFCKKNKIPFITVISDINSIIITNDYSVNTQNTEGQKNTSLAWPAGALVIEEARKVIMAGKTESQKLYFNPKINYPFENTNSDSNQNHKIKNYKIDVSDKTALVVGLGGQGCFAVPILAKSNYKKIIYMDHDTVEDHNLSRQPLFWDSVGLKKAEIAAKKHNTIIGKENATAVVQKFDENFEVPQDVDIIFGLTDNFYSRMLMNNCAAKRNIPFIAAGSDPDGADWCFYVPGQTTCYNHVYQSYIEQAKYNERQSRVSCMDNPNPQVVMSNCLAGSIATIFGTYILSGLIPFNGTLTYRSHLAPSFGCISKEAGCNCHKGETIDVRL